MARTEAIQLNIRSRFARERATILAEKTGMTTTQVVEEALRAYRPMADYDSAGDTSMVRKAGILVKSSRGRQVSLTQANHALDQVRSGDR